MRITNQLTTILLALVISLPVFASQSILHLPGGYFFTPATLVGTPATDEDNPKINIDKLQAKALYPYALASHMAHSYKLERSKPADHHWNFDRLEFLKLEQIKAIDLPVSASKTFKPRVTKRFEHSHSGLQARGFIHRPTSTVILAFAGTDFDATYRSAVTISASSQIAYGFRHQILTEARRLCRHLKNTPSIKSIVLTGSSLGGAVAQYAGLACNVPAVAFNSLELPDSLRRDAIYHRSKENLTEETATEAINTYNKNWLILAEVEGEYLNNKSTWGNTLFQNPHPEGVPVYVIPANTTKLSIKKRHWTPALVDSIEKASNYQFLQKPTNK
ncbi:hypothetical protein [Parendozoicomonas sp. Alg238-R29]|uniref:hypothetical protein n=1 Tax=Parendozoicomonas sp. Alg238-R29 TaxID=2993446 RepID=UPI00248DBF69|nr:hypothetical protein [Parendozoicomonas sp. Alg238-R29]